MNKNYGTGIQERKIDEYNVKIDGRNATISAQIPKDDDDDYFSRKDDAIYMNPVNMLKPGVIPSLSMIRFSKYKNFVDGVYAAVEERVAENGHELSRTDVLKKVSKYVSGRAQEYINKVKDLDVGQDPGLAIPHAFYDWTEGLRDAFKQIKLTARTPSALIGGDEKLDQVVMKEIYQAMQNSGMQYSYDQINALYRRMTGEQELVQSLFPSAMLPDQKFFLDYSKETQSDIEEGLGKALVQALKDERISFVPDIDSGLYIRQMHEVTPLVLRDTPEFEKYLVDKEYAKALEKEFISQWAATRHTHVAHTDYSRMLLGCSASHSSPIYIYPELKLEPLATTYKRMEESINFLEWTVTTFMPEVLDGKRWIKEGLKSEKTLKEEFGDMKKLLSGLNLISQDSIHMSYKHANPAHTASVIDYASKWLDSIKSDPDMDRDVAIFVPIIRTTDGKKQISYINAGYKTIDLEVKYDIPPKVDIDAPEFSFVRHKFMDKTYKLPMLVHKELRVPYDMHMPNDRQVRKLLKSKFSEKELEAVVKKLESEQ